MKVFVVQQLAKETEGDFVSCMVEFVTKDKDKAEKYAKDKQITDGSINIDGHFCQVVRQIVPADVED